MRFSRYVVLVFAFCAGCQQTDATMTAESKNKIGLSSRNGRSGIQHQFVNGAAYCLLSDLDSKEPHLRCSSLKDDSLLETPIFLNNDVEKVPRQIFSGRTGDICALFKRNGIEGSNQILCWWYSTDSSTHSLKMNSSYVGEIPSGTLLSIDTIQSDQWSFSVAPSGRLSVNFLAYDIYLSNPQDIAPVTIDGRAGNRPVLLYTIDSSGLKAWEIRGRPEQGLRFKEFENSPPQVSNPWRVVVNQTDNASACVLGKDDVKCWTYQWWDNQPFEELRIPQLGQPKELIPYKHGFCALDSSGIVCWNPVSQASSPTPGLRLRLGESFGPRNQKLVNPRSLIADWGRFCVHDEEQIKCWTESSMKSEKFEAQPPRSGSPQAGEPRAGEIHAAQTPPFFPPSGNAVDFETDTVTSNKTWLIYGYEGSPERALCQAFLTELEKGKTDLIENLPLVEKQKHQILRGCTKGILGGNALMVVARASYPISRKLEIFKLLIGKYRFPTNLRSHNSGGFDDKDPNGHYSVFNVTVATDDLLPLTEYLVAQNAVGTTISYPFGYNGARDWCRTPLILGTLVPNELGSQGPVFSLRDTIQIKTFKLLVEKNYASALTPTNNADCTGQYPRESVLSLLERIRDWNYRHVNNLDEAIEFLKNQGHP